MALDTMMVLPGERLAPGQVALWEQHPEHPDGEVFIAAPHADEQQPNAVKVAATPEVMLRLSDGRLQQVNRRGQRADEAPEPEPARAPRRGAPEA